MERPDDKTLREVERPTVGIAFIVREKFGWALAGLKRIYQFIDTPFTLYFIDCGYPPIVRKEIDAFLADQTNVVYVTSERFLLPNESLNLVIPWLQEHYLCIIQNDVLIEPGYMRALLATFDEHHCDIVWPMTFDLQDGRREPHRDEFTDTRIREVNGGLLVQVSEPPPADPPPPVRQIQHFELHTLMMTASAAKLVYPLPVINTREHIDLAANAYRRGMAVYANEHARAGYVLPPIRDFDVAYFKFRWDMEVAAASHTNVARRWDIIHLPMSMAFVRQHNAYATPNRVLLHNESEPCELDVYAADSLA